MDPGIIKTVHPGVFWSLLDHPTSGLLRDLLDPTAPYVLCWGHRVGQYRWETFSLPIASPDRPMTVQARVAQFDFLCSTGQFLSWLPDLRPGIRAVQLRSMPPDYLDLQKIRGNQLWRALGECGWHVLLDTPGNDYGEVASPHREVVERAVARCGGAS